jgi:hypothetical protein
MMTPDTESVSHSQGVITMVATKTTAKKAAAKPVAKKAAVTKPVAAAQAFVAEAVETVTEQADVAASFARDFALTSIGMPFVVQKQIRQFPAVNLDSVKAIFTERPDFGGVKAVLNDAKLTGAVRVAKFQGRVQPYTEKIEARLPDRFVKVIESGRLHVRNLIAA